MKTLTTRRILLIVAIVTLAGCAEDAVRPESTASTAVADSGEPSKKLCSSDTATGSLIQKRTTCASEDANRNGVSDSFQTFSRPNNMAGAGR